MADNDFKYVLQDFSNIYIGARSSYGELAENEDLPHKLREVIVRIFLTETAEDTTPENHLFYLTKDSASYRALKKMKARFRMSVWEEADGKKRKKSGYVTGNTDWTRSWTAGSCTPKRTALSWRRCTSASWGFRWWWSEWPHEKGNRTDGRLYRSEQNCMGI